MDKEAGVGVGVGVGAGVCVGVDEDVDEDVGDGVEEGDGNWEGEAEAEGDGFGPREVVGSEEKNGGRTPAAKEAIRRAAATAPITSKTPLFNTTLIKQYRANRYFGVSINSL